YSSLPLSCVYEASYAYEDCAAGNVTVFATALSIFGGGLAGGVVLTGVVYVCKAPRVPPLVVLGCAELPETGRSMMSTPRPGGVVLNVPGRPVNAEPGSGALGSGATTRIGPPLLLTNWLGVEGDVDDNGRGVELFGVKPPGGAYGVAEGAVDGVGVTIG